MPYDSRFADREDHRDQLSSREASARHILAHTKTSDISLNRLPGIGRGVAICGVSLTRFPAAKTWGYGLPQHMASSTAYSMYSHRSGCCVKCFGAHAMQKRQERPSADAEESSPRLCLQTVVTKSPEIRYACRREPDFCEHTRPQCKAQLIGQACQRPLP